MYSATRIFLSALTTKRAMVLGISTKSPALASSLLTGWSGSKVRVVLASAGDDADDDGLLGGVVGDLDRRDDDVLLGEGLDGEHALLEVVAGGDADRDLGALVAADDLDGLVGGDDRAGEVAAVVGDDLQDVALVHDDHAVALTVDAAAGLGRHAAAAGLDGDGGVVLAGGDGVPAAQVEAVPVLPGGDQVVAGPGVDREHERGVVGDVGVERVVLIDGDRAGRAQAVGAVGDEDGRARAGG
jgi:hypothetical protein